MPKEVYTVLLADDSEDDRLFIRRALRRNPRFMLVGEVADGVAAVAWLSGENKFCDRQKFPFPDVLLLDLKMPRMTGHEVLGWLQTRSFPGLSVVVVSGSFLPRDIADSRALGAHAYFKKNASEEHQLSMLGDIVELLDHI